MSIIVGLDLSTRGLGMVAVPTDWDLNWKRVRFASLAYPLREDATPAEQVARLRALSGDVCVWCDRVGATEVWAEDQPGYVPPKTMHSFKKNAELRGVIRVELSSRNGLTLGFIDEATVRELLLGWLPGKNRKEHVAEALKAAGDPFDYDDERDGYAVANWRLNELGAPCLHDLLGPKPAKPKAPRSRSKKATRPPLQEELGSA